MATDYIRFLSPREPNLSLPSVPAQFHNGVFDQSVDDTRAITRMRYLGAPYGVIELDAAPAIDPWATEDQIVQSIRNPVSPIGAALRQFFQEKAQ